MYRQSLSNSEINRISANLLKIETALGHPVSADMVDPFSLKDDLLTPDQLNRICANIQRIEFMRGTSRGRQRANDAIGEIILLLLYIIIGSIIVAIKNG